MAYNPVRYRNNEREVRFHRAAGSRAGRIPVRTLAFFEVESEDIGRVDMRFPKRLFPDQVTQGFFFKTNRWKN